VCPSRIRSVVVYARGAVVTRRVDVPEGLPPHPIDLAIEAISPLAKPGTFRVDVDGSRDALGVVTELEIPEDPLPAGDLTRAIEETRRAIADRNVERGRLEARRAQIQGTAPIPRLARRKGSEAPDRRIEHALAAREMLQGIEADLDRRAVAIDRELFDLHRRLEDLETEARQRESGAVRAKHPPETRAIVRIAPGDGPIRSIDLSYAIDQARWWPTYAVHLTDNAKRAEVSVEALVAQASLEDWKEARISLSTADLVEDVRLPEIASLRLGRAQPPKKRGFRPPPPDLDALFSGFDRALAGARPASGGKPPALARLSRRVDRPRNEMVTSKPVAASMIEDAVSFDDDDDDGASFVDQTTTGGVLFAHSFGSAPPPPPRGAPADTARAYPAPSAAPAFEAQAMMPMSKGRAMGPGALIGGMIGAAAGGIAALAESETRRYATAVPSEIEPADAWLDFDSLEMAGADDPRRGRLFRVDVRAEVWITLAAEVRLEDVTSHELPDPRESRGSFDHRYDSEGTADVPSNGLPHRVSLAKRSVAARPRFVTVPRMDPSVFREVELENPLDSPLLRGPVDVMLDGALLSTSRIEDPVERGGTFTVGLGVEERIRVARNARVHETTIGMLSSSTAVDHHVTVELVSALGYPVTVEVYDRLPVTDDRNVEVQIVESTPKPEEYDQKERGRPIEGGMRWRVPIDAAGRRAVAYTYRIELPSKSEIEGGNRRE
jgi:hypothetical protein